MPTASNSEDNSIDQPMVFNVGADPIKVSLVGSFNRPASNVTGLYFVTTQLEPKRLQILGEIVAKAGVIAVLVNPKSPEIGNITNEVEAPAVILERQVRLLNASVESDFDPASRPWSNSALARFSSLPIRC